MITCLATRLAELEWVKPSVDHTRLWCLLPLFKNTFIDCKNKENYGYKYSRIHINQIC